MNGRFVLRSILVCFIVSAILPSAFGATILVNTTTDTAPANNGLCTLREAIIAANTNTPSGGAPGECAGDGAGLDNITFNLGAGVQTITVANALGPLPLMTSPMNIDGTTESGTVVNTSPSATNAVLQVRISGTGLSDPAAYGFRLGTGSNGSTIRGLIITGFETGAIHVQSSNNTIAGNFIGTANGTSAAGNGTVGGRGGVDIMGDATHSPSGNTVGGSVPADRNLISGNGPGVLIVTFAAGSTVNGNTIRGNIIGLNAAGTAAITAPPFLNPGINFVVSSGSVISNTTIGGTVGTTPGGACTGACNLISGNDLGIQASSGISHPQLIEGLTIQGNFIGPDAVGTTAIGNGGNPGINITNVIDDVLIGGTTAGARNVVSGGGGGGINVSMSDAAHDNGDPNTITIQGNFIGTTTTGLVALPNSGTGISIGQAHDTTIGGTVAGAGNVVSANNGGGILVTGSPAIAIQGNLIGLGANGTTLLPNGGIFGIRFDAGSGAPFVSTNSIVGAATAGGAGGNTILVTSSVSITGILLIDPAIGIKMFSNSIRTTPGELTRRAIDLNGNGPSANDANDGDAGTNNSQNFPVLTSADSNGVSTTIAGTLNSDANQAFTVEFFSNPPADPQARTPIGSTTVNTVGNNGAFNVTLPVGTAAGDVITSTATHATNGTSEVSAGVAVVALSPPTVTKSFLSDPISPGGASVLAITISNPNASGLSIVSLTDNYPGAIVNSLAPSASTDCGGSLTATSGGGSITMTGGTVPASSFCTINVIVTSSTPGTHTNTINPADVITAGGSPAAPATDTLTVLSPPTVSKAFGTDPIAIGGTSVLTITVTNPNASPIGINSVTDNYPADIVNAATPAGSNTCGGSVSAVAAGGSVTLTGGTIPASGNCTITVTVTSSTVGTHTNTIPPANVVTNAGTAAAGASDTLTVGNPPTVTKAFGTDPIAVGGTSVLTITLTNPNASPVTITSMTDTYPAAIVNAATPAGGNTCGGSVTAAPGGASVVLNGGTIPGSGSCTITVTVTSNTIGTHTNTIPPANVITNGGTPAAAASDTLTVGSAPTVSKAFAPNPIAAGGTSVLTITLTNGNPVPITGVAFTDTYPAAISNTATPAGATNCGGTVTATAGGGSVGLTGGTIPASGSCTVTVNVTSVTPGSHTNTIPAGAGGVTSSNAGANTTPSTANLNVNALVAPTATKSFTPPSIQPGQSSVLTITLSNSNLVPVTGVNFTDNYPAGLVNTLTPNGATTCGAGIVTAAPGGSSLALANGTIPASGSCTVTVNVTLQPGTQSAANSIPAGNIQSANAPATGAPANATLAINSDIPALSTIALFALAMLLGIAAVFVMKR